MQLTTKPSEVVQAAAAFFIEQILLKPGADSYHILGARPDAAGAELRQNLALLLRWLHPDASQNAHRSIFVDARHQRLERSKDPGAPRGL